MSKYKKSLRNYLIYVIFIIIILIAIETYIPGQEISPYIVGSGFVEKFMVFVIFWTIGAIIGALVFGYILGPLFLFMHKVTVGRKMQYGVQDNLESENPRLFSKAIFPALMALNFALMFAINPDVVALIVNLNLSGNESMGGSLNTIVAFLVLLSLTVGVGMAIFSPVWFLLDAGIVYSNQEKVRETPLEVPIIARSVGGWYQYLLKGYAGIAVIFGYYQLVSTFLGGMVGSSADPILGIIIIINVLILLPIVFLIALASIPGMIILDKTKSHRIKYMRKWASKFGINEKVQINFEKQTQ